MSCGSGLRQVGELWGRCGANGCGNWLRGEDFDMSETEHLKSISHQHVLAPEMRTPEKAWAVAHKLLHKRPCGCARRIVGQQHWVGDRVCGAEERNEAHKQLRPAHAGWKGELKLSECQDNQTLIAALSRLWPASRGVGSSTIRTLSACI